MDRLDAMHMFVRVVETSSFTKVAHEFATTQPTVTKQIAAMEARLKVRLLNRNTRGVSLTEAGALYYEKCKTIVNDVAEADKVVQVRQTQVQGQLRIGSSVAFGRRVLIPLALEFMAHNPQVQVDLSFEDRYTDLVANGIDVALRLGRSEEHTSELQSQSNLVCRLLLEKKKNKLGAERPCSAGSAVRRGSGHVCPAHLRQRRCEVQTTRIERACRSSRLSLAQALSVFGK